MILTALHENACEQEVKPQAFTNGGSIAECGFPLHGVFSAGQVVCAIAVTAVLNGGSSSGGGAS